MSSYWNVGRFLGACCLSTMMTGSFLLAQELGEISDETEDAAQRSEAGWDIGVSRVHVPKMGPELFIVFGQSYWVLPYSFEPIPTQDRLADDLEKVIQNTKDDGARDLYKAQYAILREAQGKSRYAYPSVMLNIPDREVQFDLVSAGVRNAYERHVKRRFYTPEEISAIPLDKLRTRTDDSGYIRRKVVDVLAVFTAPDEWPARFTVNIQGLGSHQNPSFEPGVLVFWNLSLPKESGELYQPSYRKTVRFSYESAGSDKLGEYRLRTSEEGWDWLWGDDIYAGSVRMVTPERPSGSSRDMFYFPYSIRNNTGKARSFSVVEAGVRVPVEWEGLELEVMFGDKPELKDFWRTLVTREVEERVNEGVERIFVDEHDADRILSDEADRKAKVEIAKSAIQASSRHPAGVLEAQKRVNGMAIFTGEMDNLEEVAEQIKVGLVGRVLRNPSPKEEESVNESNLLREYRKLVVALKAEKPDTLRLAASVRLPEERKVWRLLLRTAAEELYESGDMPTAEEARKFNRHEFVDVVMSDVKNWTIMRDALAEGGAAARLAAALSDTVKGFISKKDASYGDRLTALAALNQVLRKEDLFTSEDYDSVELDEEGKDMAQRGFDFDRKKIVHLTPKEIFKLNRLMLDKIVGVQGIYPCLDWAWLGHRLDSLAVEKIKAFSEEGRTSIYFVADVNGVRERSEKIVNTRDVLPPVMPVYRMPTEEELAQRLRVATTAAMTVATPAPTVVETTEEETTEVPTTTIDIDW